MNDKPTPEARTPLTENSIVEFEGEQALAFMEVCEARDLAILRAEVLQAQLDHLRQSASPQGGVDREALVDWIQNNLGAALQVGISGEDAEHYADALLSAFPAAARAPSERFAIVTDNDSHWYLIPAARKTEWDAWADIPSDDERAWTEPDFAKRIDGPYRLTFTDPQGA